MRKIFILPFIFAVILLLGACSSGEFKADYKVKVNPFEFTNQKEQDVSLEDLKGEVWLAQFVFTNCITVCGPMMHNMAELQDALIEEGVEDYKIVSFTVDPQNDTPKEMQNYLELFAPADESKWEMLSGYKQDTIIELAKKSFMTIVANDPNGSDQVIHGVSFILVDQEGNVVKMYNGAGEEGLPFSNYMDDIVQDVKMLSKQGA